MYCTGWGNLLGYIFSFLFTKQTVKRQIFTAVFQKDKSKAVIFRSQTNGVTWTAKSRISALGNKYEQKLLDRVRPLVLIFIFCSLPLDRKGPKKVLTLPLSVGYWVNMSIGQLSVFLKNGFFEIFAWI